MTGTQPAQVTAEAARQALPLLRGVALLAGSVSGSSLAHQVGRSGLELPLSEEGETIGSAWLRAIGSLETSDDPLPVWALVDGVTRTPAMDDRLVVRRDQGDLRGAGGALRDLAAEIGPEGRVLVIAGAQAPLEPVAGLAAELASACGDIILLDGPRQPPGSVMLASCEALASMRSVGFVDLKEQGLPELAARFDIRVLCTIEQLTFPLRTREQYIDALRWLALRTYSAPDPLAERWQSAFAIVEPGAEVADTAKLCDSVALRGAQIGSGATVVRSVVAGRVEPGETIVDAIIGPAGSRGGRS